MLKYPHVCQQANVTCPEPVEGTRQQAPDIAENRTNRASRPKRKSWAASKDQILSCRQASWG